LSTPIAPEVPLEKRDLPPGIFTFTRRNNPVDKRAAITEAKIDAKITDATLR